MPGAGVNYNVFGAAKVLGEEGPGNPTGAASVYLTIMKYAKRAAVIAGAVGILAAVAWAQSSVTLRLKPPVGSKYQYKVTMTTNSGMGNQGNMSMNGTFTQWMTVKGKDSKGTKIETKVTNAKFTGPAGMNGDQIAQSMNNQVITATYSALGAYVSGDMQSGTPGAMAAQAGAQGVIFPSQAVKVGSTWSSTVDIGKLMAANGAGNMKVVSGGKIPVNFKLTGMKTIAGKPIVGVSSTMNGTVVLAVGEQQMSLALKATGSGQVDVGTGMVRTWDTNANVGTTVGQMKINQTIKVTMALQ